MSARPVQLAATASPFASMARPLPGGPQIIYACDSVPEISSASSFYGLLLPRISWWAWQAGPFLSSWTPSRRRSARARWKSNLGEHLFVHALCGLPVTSMTRNLSGSAAVSGGRRRARWWNSSMRSSILSPWLLPLAGHALGDVDVEKQREVRAEAVGGYHWPARSGSMPSPWAW